MDKRVFVLGISMLAVGLLAWAYFNSTEPIGKAGMTEEETNMFYQELAVNMGLKNMSGLVAGFGFFITLISIGLKRRKKGGTGKPVTQKPMES